LNLKIHFFTPDHCADSKAFILGDTGTLNSAFLFPFKIIYSGGGAAASSGTASSPGAASVSGAGASAGGDSLWKRGAGGEAERRSALLGREGDRGEGGAEKVCYLIP
jgi:hypothetical protein